MAVLSQVDDWRCTCLMCYDKIQFTRNVTYNSARHSISTFDPGAEEIVEDVEAALSSSDLTATITAAIS